MKIRKYILSIIAIVLLSSFTLSLESEFNKGYKKGYKKGYCYDIVGCFEPIPPIPPIPNINESSTSYDDGYDRGFTDGKEDQQ